MTGLSDGEKQEMKGLQDKRKETGGHMTDSERARLSELLTKAGEEKNKPAPAAATAASTAVKK